MQALGSYRARRMLFLGLGTGLGAALIVDGVLGGVSFHYKNGSPTVVETRSGRRVVLGSH